MNKKPVNYFQTDRRWKNLPYRVKGETATIGGSGCGPTSAAMAIESITGKQFTPVDACEWSMKHGYKALHAGTYQSYFVPQFADHGIQCEMLKTLDHNRVKAAVQDGYYAIALMGKGNWTNGGHYILVWDWDDKVRINDSVSTRDVRINGDPKTFMNEVRKYWLIDAREYNKGEDYDMTDERFAEFMDRYLASRAKLPEPEWSVNTGEWQAAADAGIIAEKAGPQMLASKAEVAAMILRGMKKGE